MKKHFRLYEGIDGIVHTIVGLSKSLFLSQKKIREYAKASYEYSNTLSDMPQDEFCAMILATIHSIKKKQYDNIKHIGIIAQAVYRVYGITPHIEQLMGVHAIANAYIIQMHTGEGKTLTAGMGAVYQAWQSNNCHVVTSNDYLAQRDAQKMGALFEFCYLNVGYVISTTDHDKRKEIYDKKIVYSTSKELLADYLRDQDEYIFQRYHTQELLAKVQNHTTKQKVMRGLDSIIIDEADSVLADEATVPLIIASLSDQPFFVEAMSAIYDISKKLTQDKHYKVNTKHKEITITKEAKEEYKKYINQVPQLWQSQNRLEYLLRQILLAEYFYIKDNHYIIKDDKIVIIDEKTGRQMEGRSWGGALHQAIEVKEGVTLTNMTKTHKKMSFQFFFRLYKNLSGMSGTLHNIHREIWSIYERLILHIPTHSPKKVKMYQEIICKDSDTKWELVSQDAIYEATKGKAVLIGTNTIQESMRVYQQIIQRYDNVCLLNAKQQDQEAQIISQAGKSSKITIATNIAGRGTDILLDDDVIVAGGLHVVATQRHESKRVDMQLYGRSGRQGQVGSIRSIISLDDYLFTKYSPKILTNTIQKLIATQKGQILISKYFDILQYMSEKSISKLRKDAFVADIKTIKKISFTS